MYSNFEKYATYVKISFCTMQMQNNNGDHAKIFFCYRFGGNVQRATGVEKGSTGKRENHKGSCELCMRYFGKLKIPIVAVT
jgi:hypothetical protein